MLPYRIKQGVWVGVIQGPRRSVISKGTVCFLLFLVVVESASMAFIISHSRSAQLAGQLWSLLLARVLWGCTPLHTPDHGEQLHRQHPQNFRPRATGCRYHIRQTSYPPAPVVVLTTQASVPAAFCDQHTGHAMSTKACKVCRMPCSISCLDQCLCACMMPAGGACANDPAYLTRYPCGDGCVLWLLCSGLCDVCQVQRKFLFLID